MGILFNNPKDIKEKIREKFNDDENYLIAKKHNDIKTGLLELIVSNLYYTIDSNRTFIIYFDKKGIYEKEISNSIKGDFILMPENEIGEIAYEEKSTKAIISLTHLGKKISYEIPFSGKIFRQNKENFEKIKNKNWNRIWP